MTDWQEQAQLVTKFQESLKRVVDLGFGGDECDPVVTVMFERLVRDAVRPQEVARLPFRLPAAHLGSEITHAKLLNQTTQLRRFIESGANDCNSPPKRDPIVFPFLTALGMAGGVFLLVFHIARLAPHLLERVGLLS